MRYLSKSNDKFNKEEEPSAALSLQQLELKARQVCTTGLSRSATVTNFTKFKEAFTSTFMLHCMLVAQNAMQNSTTPRDFMYLFSEKKVHMQEVLVQLDFSELLLSCIPKN